MSLGGSGAPSGGSIGGGGYEVHFTGSGGSNDGPTIASNIASCAALGWRLVLHGAIAVTSTIATPANGNAALVHLAADCNIQSTISAAPTFLADSLSTAANPPGGATTISGSPAAGAKSVTTNVAHGLSTGDTIIFGSSNNTYNETHTVRAGSSGTTLNLVEPIAVPPPSNAPVYKLAGLATLVVTADPGAKMTGTASNAFEILCGRFCRLSGFTISMSLTGGVDPGAIYLDWATTASTVSDVTIINGASSDSAAVAVGLEQCVDITVERVIVDQTAKQFGATFEVTTTTNGGFYNCHAPGSIAGINFDVVNSSGTFGSHGCRGCVVVGCHFPDSGAGGAVTVKNGGLGVHVIGLNAPRSAAWAVNTYAPDTSVNPENVVITGGDFTASAGTAVLCSGGTGHRFSGFDGTGSVTTIQVSGGVVHADGFTADNCTGSAVWHAGGDAQYTNFSADNCSYASQGAIRVNGGSKRVSFARFSARSATFAALDFQSTSATFAIDVSGGDITDSGTSGNQGAVLYSGRIYLKNLDVGYRTDPGSGTRYILKCGSTADITLEDVTVFTQATPGGHRVAVGLESTTVTVRAERAKISNIGSAGANGGSNFGVLADAAGTFLDLGGVDLSFASSNAYVGTFSSNVVAFTATGSAVTVNNIASPGAKAVWGWQLTAASGTVGAPFQATAISAGSATFNSTNSADRSTWTGALR